MPNTSQDHTKQIGQFANKVFNGNHPGAISHWHKSYSPVRHTIPSEGHSRLKVQQREKFVNHREAKQAALMQKNQNFAWILIYLLASGLVLPAVEAKLTSKKSSREKNICQPNHWSTSNKPAGYSVVNYHVNDPRTHIVSPYIPKQCLDAQTTPECRAIFQNFMDMNERYAPEIAKALKIETEAMLKGARHYKSLEQKLASCSLHDDDVKISIAALLKVAFVMGMDREAFITEPNYSLKAEYERYGANCIDHRIDQIQKLTMASQEKVILAVTISSMDPTGYLSYTRGGGNHREAHNFVLVLDDATLLHNLELQLFSSQLSKKSPEVKKYLMSLYTKGAYVCDFWNDKQGRLEPWEIRNPHSVYHIPEGEDAEVSITVMSPKYIAMHLKDILSSDIPKRQKKIISGAFRDFFTPLCTSERKVDNQAFCDIFLPTKGKKDEL